MWDEIIKLKANNFYLAKQKDDSYYSVIDKNYNIILNDNVKRWFNNGFILCEEHCVFTIYGPDHDRDFDYFFYKIFNNDLNEIFSYKSDLSENEKPIIDFKYGFLAITTYYGYYGAIDENGSTVIGFSHSLKEVNERISILGFLSDAIKDDRLKQRAVLDLLACISVNENVQAIRFIKNLLTKYQNFYEILFHIILYRESSFERDISHRTNLSYLKDQFAINYILEWLHGNMGTYLPRNLSIFASYDFEGRRNDSLYFENKIIISYPLDIKHNKKLNENLEKLKMQLINLCGSFPSVNFDEDKFEKLKFNLKGKMLSASPLIKGRKVQIKNYLTLESNYTKKCFDGHSVLYNQKADFLDTHKFKNVHVVSDCINSNIQYLVEYDSISLDFSSYTYEDFIGLLK